MRIFRRSDGYEEEDLVQSATDHMGAAVLLLKRSPSFYDAGGYLAHLSIELLLKALLLAIDDEFRGEHDLAKLVTHLQRRMPGFGFNQRGMEALRLANTFRELRYPNRRHPVEIGSDDVELLVGLYKAIIRALPPALLPEPDDSGNVTKGGRVLMMKPITATPPSKRLQPTARRRQTRRG
jgi:HEPN domain-containing protein